MTTPVSASTRSPRVGCGAAIVRDDKLLLVKRRRPPEAGHWGLPGGKLDWMETVKNAVAREIAEELGIVIRPERLLCVVDHIDPAADAHWVAPVFHVTAIEGEPRVLEPEALEACGWFDLDALPAPLTQVTVAAVSALRSRA